MSEKAAREALSHPLVLRGAWLRVDAWYRGGDLAAEPELSLWRLHPEAKLRQLGAALRAGTWAPSEWPQIPYPKKGARLRHYVLPTVEDQVAFMAHLVLLGPLFDSCVANFASVIGGIDHLFGIAEGKKRSGVGSSGRTLYSRARPTGPLLRRTAYTSAWPTGRSLG